MYIKNIYNTYVYKKTDAIYMHIKKRVVTYKINNKLRINIFLIKLNLITCHIYTYILYILS